MHRLQFIFQRKRTYRFLWKKRKNIMRLEVHRIPLGALVSIEKNIFLAKDSLFHSLQDVNIFIILNDFHHFVRYETSDQSKIYNFQRQLSVRFFFILSFNSRIIVAFDVIVFQPVVFTNSS